MKQPIILRINMGLPDGPGWSPDGGKYWVKDGVTYWGNGRVTSGGVIFRTMPGGFRHDEDYSAWTPEHRASVLADTELLAAENEAKRRIENERVQELRRSAKSKLTPEEIEACGLNREFEP